MISLRERFESSYELEPNTGCWLWTGFLVGHGKFKYAGIKHQRKILKGHRLSWEFHRGVIPRGLHVCHHCDTPPCVNPDHLFVGTNSDNMQDMIRKGRQVRVQGEQMPTSKLTRAAVRVICRLRGRVLQSRIGEMFGISDSLVSMILSGRRWAHATEDLR